MGMLLRPELCRGVQLSFECAIKSHFSAIYYKAALSAALWSVDRRSFCAKLHAPSGKVSHRRLAQEVVEPVRKSCTRQTHAPRGTSSTVGAGGFYASRQARPGL